MTQSRNSKTTGTPGARAPVAAETVRVDLGPRGYDIHIGAGLLGRAGALIAPCLKIPRVAIVTDRTVAGLYLDGLRKSLDQAGIAHDEVILPPGEGTKDIAHFQMLTDALLDLRVERASTLIALGGGVIGDLTGFAASTLLRGIDFIQVPTTLLAQVDSSVGGKTGINTRHGKNLIGAFHQPRLVVADVGLLDSLAKRQLLAGYAEIVKYGLIGDAGFFAWLEAHGAALLDGSVEARVQAVRTSCAAKASIVATDEREGGARALLNLGHTFAHALEAETGFGDALLHGEAVSIGLALAHDLSVALGFCSANDAARAARHLAAVGLPTRLLTGLLSERTAKKRRWDIPALLGHMESDKKVRAGRITFVLSRGIGKAFLANDVPIDTVRTVLEKATA